MDKRLAKRHKRQVTRAREKVRVSEPDVRTPEQITAAREASRPDLRKDTPVWARPRTDTAVPKAEAPTEAEEPAKADEPTKADPAE